ncbi:MAG: sigma-70 family RNA polymerase sigma factor [Gemmataceae bacterium]|nr:sigma-70 family RNA polymerase sigma factor [Gemmataceae bacterium]
MPRLATAPPAKGSSGVAEAARCHDPEIGLMLRVRRDDPGAFAELVEQYWTKVFGRFVRWLGDRQEAEDLAQDVFLRLYRSRQRYEPRAKFATWLFHISRNVARNALRSRRRRPCVRLSALYGPDRDTTGERTLVDGSASPSQPLERSELAGVVRSAVSGLGGRQRTALEMFQFQDRSYAEIAAEMDMSPKAAKSLLYRARNQLRATLTHLVEVP